ncbi:MAG: hypothetical protein SFU86_23800 [Pirellulaceae bacterium]|nr:hypothetical protein [Pirellulaceae bacterium]
MKPVLQALLLADHVYEDRTGKKIIAGTFSRLWFKKVPPPQEVAGERRMPLQGVTVAGSPYIFISLTELRGRQKYVLRYVNLETDTQIFQVDFAAECDNPLQTVEVVIPLPPLPAAKAGAHAFELLCENEPIGSLRILVEEAP